MQKTKGFNLTEIMVSIAIIGIVATIGYPAYTRYTTKNVLSDGFIAADRTKKAVMSFYIEKENINMDASNITDFSFKNGIIRWNKAQTRIEITYGNSATTGCSVVGKTSGNCAQLYLKASVVGDKVLWKCQNSQTANNQVPDDSLPSACK